MDHAATGRTGSRFGNGMMEEGITSCTELRRGVREAWLWDQAEGVRRSGEHRVCSATLLSMADEPIER